MQNSIPSLKCSSFLHARPCDRKCHTISTVSSVWLLWAVATVATADRKQHGYHEISTDPNSQFMCRGELSEHAACQCRDDDGELSCINAQFVDTDVFTNINAHYKSLKKITFHGNNFQDLPSTSLFGDTTQVYLLTLNISANYIVNLHSNALTGMPNLRVLDMSNNEIVLKKSDHDFLRHTPHLRELYLRRAFTATLNRTIQFSLMMEMFTKAKLENLEVLDLSYNYLQSVPYNLACPFPSIKKLDLRQNLLKNLIINSTCLLKLRTLDLSRNSFHNLSRSMMDMSSRMQDDSIVMRNPFHCDCNSREYISFLRSSTTFRDANSLFCEKASPKRLDGTRLLEVQLGQLDCSRNLDPTAVTSNAMPSLFIVLAVILFHF